LEGKAILRELTNSRYDCIAISEILTERQNSLKEYVGKKDEFYKRIRRIRLKRK
jgi:hypothetical protein